MSQTPSQSTLAKALGLSKQMVSKLKKQGMPVDSVEAAMAWREKNLNIAQRKDVMNRPDAAPGRAEVFEPIAVNGLRVFGTNPPSPPSPPPSPPEFSFDDDTLSEDFKSAKTRYTIADANLKELEEAKERHELIRVSVVQAQLATDYATTRDAMLQIPARMGPLLAAESDPAVVQNLLHAEIHEALMQLAGAAERVPALEGGFE